MASHPFLLLLYLLAFGSDGGEGEPAGGARKEDGDAGMRGGGSEGPQGGEAIIWQHLSYVAPHPQNCPAREINGSLTPPSPTPPASPSVILAAGGKKEMERIRFCNVPDVENEEEEEVVEGPEGSDKRRSNESATPGLRRVRRYTLHGKKWDKTTLKWTLRQPSRHTNRLDSGTIRQQLQAAMRVWEAVSTLSFVEVHRESTEVDIYVDFIEGNHGDGYPFMGEGGALAHAFYPGPKIGGDVHFDDGDVFVTHHDRESGKNSLLITAAHELGHSLGLRHSDVSTALMTPYYQDFPDHFVLPEDDTRAIQVLYGRPYNASTPPPIPTRPPRPPATSPPRRPPTTPSRPRPPATPPPPRPSTTRPQPRPPTMRPPPRPPRPPYTPGPRPPFTPAPPHTTTTTTTTLPPPHRGACPAVPPPPPDGPSRDCCPTGTLDAATEFRGEIFFFQGQHYWRVSRRGPPHSAEFPGRIEQRFPSVRRVDAAYVTPKGHLVLFEGRSFTQLGHMLTVTRQGSLADLGVDAQHVDAAMLWGHNGRVYVFSGARYWRLGRDGIAEPDYPRDAAVWRDVPANVSAAFTLGTKTFFLAGRVFWSFDSLAMRLRQPPLLVAPYWLSCPLCDKQKELVLCSSGTAAPPAVTPLVLLALLPLLPNAP